MMLLLRCCCVAFTFPVHVLCCKVWFQKQMSFAPKVLVACWKPASSVDRYRLNSHVSNYICSILELLLLPLSLFSPSFFFLPLSLSLSRQRDSLRSALLPIMWTSSSLSLQMLTHQSSEYVGERKRGRVGGVERWRRVEKQGRQRCIGENSQKYVR